MVIPVPERAPAMWEAPMEVDDAVQVRGRLDGRDLPPDLPVASIGHPEVWRVADVFDDARVPALVRSKLGEAEFHLVRFGCSFRPTDAAGRSHRIAWARFSVDLLPDSRDVSPIAFDLFPLSIERTSTRKRTLTFSPSLTFQDVEVGLGDVSFGVEYPAQEALVSAAGVGESLASWDYTAVPGQQIHGAQWMYAIVKSPRGFGPLRATLDLAADLATGSSVWRLLGIRDVERSRAALTVQLA